MRPNQTTHMRAIAQARKLQPEVKQTGNSLFFTVASTSMLDAWHHVTLGPNKFNPLLDAKCDCGQNRFQCLHRAAAFLKYGDNLEARLQKGSDLLHSGQLSPESDTYTDAENLFLDLLDRYEKVYDLLKAIEQGFDITQLTGAFKDRLATPFDEPTLLTA